MKKIISAIIVAVLLVSIVYIVARGSGGNTQNNAQNIKVTDGVQYVTIDAKGGYLPRISTAQSGIPTKLIVATNGTYDCSASLVIRSLGFQKILPQTGTTEIDLGVGKAGDVVNGVCGMGMYSFQVKFI